MKTGHSWFGLIVLVFLLPLYSPQGEDTGWVFKKEVSGIKIYTREVINSEIKELKFTTKIKSSISTTVALLVDVENYDKWVYKCAESTVLEELNALQSYCYYNVDFPWPMSDRDMIIYSEIKQDPITKEVVSSSYGRPEYIPEKEGRVRIYNHFNQWHFKPISANEIETTYLLKSDPAGSIPNWMINLAIDQGPLKSMKGFLSLLDDPKYKNQHLPGIEDY
ncbi:MAG: START domain-containing protein [Saprospiraceae bacterium]